MPSNFFCKLTISKNCSPGITAASQSNATMKPSCDSPEALGGRIKCGEDTQTPRKYLKTPCLRVTDAFKVRIFLVIKINGNGLDAYFKFRILRRLFDVEGGCSRNGKNRTLS